MQRFGLRSLLGGSSLRRADDGAFIDTLYRQILFREPDPAERGHWERKVAGGMSRLAVIDEMLASGEARALRRAVGGFPPGHFYSPYPSPATIEAHRAFDWKPASLPGIDLAEAHQLALLEMLAPHYAALPFGERPGEKSRYGLLNTAYAYGDGITLFCMIRHLRPRRVIEVGSGHSSCALLDAIDGLERAPEVTFVEPYPALLRSLVRPGDLERHAVVEKGLQDVPLDTFRALEAGDVLFIDSTHVAKLASDVNYLFFEVLPALAPGVWVHVHDIFYPFEYPLHWHEEGRAWNEAYLMRAFLQYNDAWRIEHFHSYLVGRHEAWFRDRMPLVLRSPGANLWMSRSK